MSKAGGGLLLVMGCVTWADKGLLLVFTPALPNVAELFTAEVMIRTKPTLLNMCYLGLLSVNNFGRCMETQEKVLQWSFGELFSSSNVKTVKPLCRPNTEFITRARKSGLR